MKIGRYKRRGVGLFVGDPRVTSGVNLAVPP